tara:strand:+ start:194 stop:1507 length:1314 start_codon:yes stop_codon:yes gene_type:complete
MKLRKLAKFMVLFALILGLTPILTGLPTLADSFRQDGARIIDFRRKQIDLDAYKTDSLNGLPDIIYIVPDRYASSETLINEYSWDNSKFYEELTQRGFKINKNAISNYPTTFQSLSSNLNAQYLSDFEKFTKSFPSDRKPLFTLTEENWAQENLKNLGYHYEHYGFWWERTKFNKFADKNYVKIIEDQKNPLLFSNLSKVTHVLFNKTPFPLIIKKILKIDTNYLTSCDFTKGKIESLRNLSEASPEKPLFIYVHMEMPHDPFLFNEYGECQNNIKYSKKEFNDPIYWEGFKRKYINYLKFTNSTLLDIFDSISERKKDLIFVIQSDEGPHPLSWRKFGSIPADTSKTMTENDWKIKSGIINAIYFSTENSLNKDDLRTPINNWIHIFNKILNKEIKTMPHNIYGIKGKNDLYNFIELNHIAEDREVFEKKDLDINL